MMGNCYLDCAGRNQDHQIGCGFCRFLFGIPTGEVELSIFHLVDRDCGDSCLSLKWRGLQGGDLSG
ncbi:hypothetical protein D3C71_1172020 [compost metagenome]